MRSENSIKNITVTISSQLISIVMSFLCQTVFIWMLGKTYLGVSAYFISILTLFSVAELGIGSAISFSMYHPLANGDRKKVGALMALYRKAYHGIGLTIAVIGLAFAPFYKCFIKDSAQTAIPHLTLIYFLYLSNAVLTYFFSYKQAIIIADQKTYVCSLYQYGFSITQNILQIVLLFLTRNFLLYLSIQILFGFFTNFFLTLKADRMYPYLRKYEKTKLSAADRSSVFKNVRAMVLQRAGFAVVNGTDTLLITTFFGLGSAAIYYCYSLIATTLNNLTANIFNSITASVGNLGATEEDRKSYRVFRSVNFAGFWIFSFCSICFFCLINPFIKFIWSDKLLFPIPVVFLIVLNFYATGMRQATITFKNAFGLFWYDRYRSIIEAAVNLGMSILLSRYIGISGIFLGTLISTVTVDLWVEPLVLFRHGFHHKLTPYFLRYALYTVLTFAVGWLTWTLCNLVGNHTFLGFAAKCMICLILPNSVYLLIFGRTREFQYLRGMIHLPAIFQRHKSA
jgi:O-antigen/teichoic acid export membrane protein